MTAQLEIQASKQLKNNKSAWKIRNKKRESFNYWDSLSTLKLLSSAKLQDEVITILVIT